MDLDELARRMWAMSNDTVVQPLSKLFLDYWEQDDRTTLYILLALAVGFVIGRFRASRASRAFSFQNYGEALLSDVVLTNFGPPDYHLMNHVTLQLKDGTTGSSLSGRPPSHQPPNQALQVTGHSAFQSVHGTIRH